MPKARRREALGDENVRASGLTRVSIRGLDMGTHAQNAYAGTITYKHGAFSGTPAVMITPIGQNSYRLAGGGTVIPVRPVSIFSGSFTYFGSPKHGTFSWLALGSFSPRA